jgi:hypothetical protein
MNLRKELPMAKEGAVVHEALQKARRLGKEQD